MDIFLNHFVGSLIAPSSGAAAIALDTMTTWYPELMQPVQQALNDIDPAQSQRLATAFQSQLQTAIFFKELKPTHRFRLYERLFQPSVSTAEMMQEVDSALQQEILLSHQMWDTGRSRAHANLAVLSSEALQVHRAYTFLRMLENIPAATDRLLQKMHAADPRDDEANSAAYYLGELAHHRPYIFDRILDIWPSPFEKSLEHQALKKRLGLILAALSRNGNREANDTLDAIRTKHPTEAGLIDRLIRDEILKPIYIKLEPKEGRDEIHIAVLSDLHHSEVNATHVERVVARLRLLNPDLVIVAGDLANDLKHYEKMLEMLQGDWKILVVPGNHDLWSTWLAEKKEAEWQNRKPDFQLPTTEELWNDVLPHMTEQEGAIWLEDRPVILDNLGIAIAGTIGWYDYSGERLGRSKEEIVSDRANTNRDRMDWDRADPEFAEARRAWLQSTLTYLNNLPIARNIFVITHVPPFVELKPPIEDEKHAEWFAARAPFYYVPTLGKTITKFPKVRATVSGHHHFGNRIRIERESMQPIDAAILHEEEPGQQDQTNEIFLITISNG